MIKMLLVKFILVFEEIEKIWLIFEVWGVYIYNLILFIKGN